MRAALPTGMARIWKKLGATLGGLLGAVLLALGPSQAAARQRAGEPLVPPTNPGSETNPASENPIGARQHGDPELPAPPRKQQDPLRGTSGSPKNSGNHMSIDQRPKR